MSPHNVDRPVGTKGVPRAEREAQLRDIAARLFGEHGYGQVSVADIARAAGVSKPMVFAYFQSKDGLHGACVDQISERLRTAIETALADPDQPADVALRTLTGIFTCLRERPTDWRVLYDRTVPTGSPAHAHSKQHRARIADLSARGVAGTLTGTAPLDPLDLSAITGIWMNSVTALVDWWIEHPGQSSEQMTARCERIFGILPAVFSPGSPA